MAFNLTMQENDLPHVRWGRIDYINVTSITTKWGVWSCVPYFPRVLLTQAGPAAHR
jgi:hypothetical protein